MTSSAKTTAPKPPSRSPRRPAKRTSAAQTVRPMPIARLIRRAAARTRHDNSVAAEITVGPYSHSAYFAPSRHRHVVADLDPIVDNAAMRPIAGPDPLLFADGAFGVVLLLDVLNRVADPQHLLAEANRGLGPDGRLYLATGLVLRVMSTAQPGQADSVGVNGLLEAAGFTVVDHRPLRNRDDYGVVARKVQALAEPHIPAGLGSVHHRRQAGDSAAVAY